MYLQGDFGLRVPRARTEGPRLGCLVRSEPCSPCPVTRYDKRVHVAGPGDTQILGSPPEDHSSGGRRVRALNSKGVESDGRVPAPDVRSHSVCHPGPHPAPRGPLRRGEAGPPSRGAHPLSLLLCASVPVLGRDNEASPTQTVCRR